MERKRAIELLIQEVDKIPYLKTLPPSNDEFRLWLKNVESIINTGLEPEDKNKYREASQFLSYLRGAHEEDLIQQDYVDEAVRYEIALKSIIQKYEILGTTEEGDKRSKVDVEKVAIEQIIGELKDFHKKLKSYGRLLDPDRQLSEAQKRYRDSLREILQRKIGNHKDIITQLTGKQFYKQFGTTGEIWAEGLRTSGYLSSMRFALTMCIDVTNEAIGKLTSDIQKGIRDAQTGELLAPLNTTKQEVIEVPPESVLREVSPQAFISHGKEGAALRKLKEFAEILGIEPLIVKERASLDKNLPDKVNLYLNQADFVIILATGDDTVKDKTTGKEIIQPRQNVIHEIGLAQKTHPGRIIYLLEEGVEFPSNIRPRVWESFKQRNMMDAFLGIVRELRAYGILEVTKFPIEENLKTK